MDNNTKGIIYVVSTPIGNLGDISHRAIDVLNEVDLIFCEDTRTSRTLLKKYNIESKLESLHMFNENSKLERITSLLDDGNNIALISDAGTPLISDPGQNTIQTLKKKGYNVIAIPGASAILAALVSSGIAFDSFGFFGFVPREEGKLRKVIINNTSLDVIIFYESPKRIYKTLNSLKSLYGDIEVTVARELTKKFEEVINNKISLILEMEIRGEIVLIIPMGELRVIENKRIIYEAINEIKTSKNFKKSISKVLENDTVKKNEIYKSLIEND